MRCNSIARFQLFQEDDTFALEATRKNDKDRSRGDGGSQSGWLVAALTGEARLLHVVSSVPAAIRFFGRLADSFFSSGLLDVCPRFVA